MSTVQNAPPIDRLRLYISDRLSSVVLHDLRNAVQAILGHTTLLQAQVSGLVAPIDLTQKLQQAAERCGRSTLDLNTILSPPSQRSSTNRLNHLLKENLPFLQSLLKERKELKLSLSPAVDAVRVQQQPLWWLVLLWMIRARELLPQGTRIQLSSEPPGAALPIEKTYPRPGTTSGVLLKLCDDGPPLSIASRTQLETPTPEPPTEPELLLFWLFGSLLHERQAFAWVEELTPGTCISVLWPQAVSMLTPASSLRP